MSELQVLAIGSEVLIDKDIPATILAFEVRGTATLVTYQCCWWDERKRQVEWLTEAEIRPKNEKRQVTITPSRSPR